LNDFSHPMRQGSQHTVIHNRHKKDIELANAFTKLLRRKKSLPTPETSQLFAAYTASNPQVAKHQIELITCLSVYSFGQMVLDQVKYPGEWRYTFSLEKVCNVMPSSSVLHDWRQELAVDNLMRMRNSL